VLDNELLAGNELSLAMLEIDATFFASDVDRKQAVRAKYDAVRWRFGLSSLVYLRLCKRVSERFANHPIMLHLFSFYELTPICLSGLTDEQAQVLVTRKAARPGFRVAPDHSRDRTHRTLNTCTERTKEQQTAPLSEGSHGETLLASNFRQRPALTDPSGTLAPSQIGGRFRT